MLESAARHLMAHFVDFWTWAHGETVHENRPLVHRVRERWFIWWQSDLARKALIADLAADVAKDPMGHDWFLNELRQLTANHGEPNDRAYGPGAPDWVFMQLAYAEPFRSTRLFERFDLEHQVGFAGLFVNPDLGRRFQVALIGLNNCGRHFEYNVMLPDTGGVSDALGAARNLLSRGPFRFFVFDRRPRGWAHHPMSLRALLAVSLVVGLGCAALLYWMHLVRAVPVDDALAVRLLSTTCVAGLLVAVSWSIGTFSDWRTERGLRTMLDEHQVAWAVSYEEESPRAIEVDGASYGAALSLAMLGALASSQAPATSWITWCVRRAQGRSSGIGITGEMAPSGKVGAVSDFGNEHEGKKKICINRKLVMFAPRQREALATEREKALGLQVRQVRDLEGLVSAAAGLGNGVVLWLGSAAAIVLVLFTILSLPIVTPPSAPSLLVNTEPLRDIPKTGISNLVVRFRTSSPERYVLRVRSTYWKPAESHFVREAGAIAIAHVDLEPQLGAVGSSTDGSVEVLLNRRLPFLSLSPVPVIEASLDRLADMYQDSKAQSSHAASNR